ncbi:MAG: DNA topoisomerase III [Desulfobulbaceae bacterium]|jgi:DNA topoisomerase-3|nr:DNA topoisomerase III [Desulfobulbaceae bacterium]
MGKTLIIAEKPSVAADIVKALPGTFTRTKTHFESDRYIVSFALGHLVSIAYPEEIDPRYQKWTIDNLPILPDEFPLTVLPETKTQFNALRKLIRSRDTDVIINACDAGREGELIFKYIIQLAATRSLESKKIERLWLRSMTLEAIREGLANLRSDEEMLPLEETAKCRSQSDWLIGINATRAMTCYNSRFGGFRKTPCGRVQTPTLSMIVKREEERRAFIPRTYWELHALFAGPGFSYEGIWIDPDFKKDDSKPDNRQDRLWDAERAAEIAARCPGRNARVKETSKKTTQGCPLLYDLTSLQREANSRFGYSAKNTLAIAQALYERHKLITYPRTDSRHLPGDYLPTVKKIFQAQVEGQFGPFAREALEKNYLKKNPKIFNDAKISDHFAIIPTGLLPGNLSEAEQKIYQMIVQRFLAIFFPPAEYLNTRRLSIVDGETFLTEGKILVYPGWKAVYGAGTDTGRDELQALPDKVPVVCEKVEQEEHQTKPPPRLSEATLLTAMEQSGRLIEDEELAEAMKERGLGTPATRAAIIEKLINEKYIIRENRELSPTGKAFELLSLLDAMQIDVLASPELTGEWEYKLNRILKGGMTATQFMAEIREQTRTIVEKIRNYMAGRKSRPEAPFSPVNNMRFFSTATMYISEDNAVRIRKVLGGRVMREEEIAALIRGETIGPFDDFRSKQGKLFTAALTMKEGKVEFIFPENGGELDTEQIKQTEPLGLSPIDNTPVFDTPAAFMSESALNGDQDKGLRISKVILGRRIDREAIVQLLEKGRTELISGFVSKKKKPFDAYLLLDDRGKLSFEFPPRRKREGRKKSGTA